MKTLNLWMETKSQEDIPVYNSCQKSNSQRCCKTSYGSNCFDKNAKIAAEIASLAAEETAAAQASEEAAVMKPENHDPNQKSHGHRM